MNQQIQTMLDQINAVRATMEEKKKELHVLLADKSLPLEDRWNLFTKCPSDMLVHDGWIQHFKTYDFSWYDDFYCERRQTIYCRDMIDNIRCAIESTPCQWDKGYAEFFRENPEKLDELKEEILADALHSFDYDW